MIQDAAFRVHAPKRRPSDISRDGFLARGAEQPLSPLSSTVRKDTLRQDQRPASKGATNGRRCPAARASNVVGHSEGHGMKF